MTLASSATGLDAMLAFYTGQLGFVLSDVVRTPEGALRACFLRSDSLHHTLNLWGKAILRS